MPAPRSPPPRRPGAAQQPADTERPAAPTPQDLELFRAAVAGAVPLPARARAALPPVAAPPRPPRPPQPQRPHAASAAPSWVEELDPMAYDGSQTEAFARPGVSPRSLQALRRGHWPVEARLDMHGMTRAAAQRACLALLEQAQHSGARCLLLIHGKGLHAPAGAGAVLKETVWALLRRHPAVLACTAAAPQDGGAGAVRVLLRRPRGQAREP